MPWIRTREFNDPALCRDGFVNSDFHVFPQQAGNFLFKLTQIGLDRLWMSRYSISLAHLNVFSIQPDRTIIGFHTEAGSSVRYCGEQLLPGDVIIHRASEARRQAETDVHAGTMSLPTDVLHIAIEAIVGCDFMQRLARPIVRPNSALMSRLLKLHRVVGQLAHDTPELIELPEVHRALEEKLIHLMVSCLAEGADVEFTAGCRRQDAIITKFEEFLAAHPNRPLYLTDICAGIGVAERTLRGACEDHLGMGPVRYLTLRRMYLVRRALLAAEASETTVTRVVTDHGFWELGRFSVAYRTLFGEMPSETLRRSAKPAVTELNRPPSLLATAISGPIN